MVFGHTQMQAAINAINGLVEVAGKPEWDWQAPAKNEALIARVTEIASAKIDEAFRLTAKQARSQQLSAIGKEVHETLVAEGVEFAANTVNNIIFDLEAKVVRGRILGGCLL